MGEILPFFLRMDEFQKYFYFTKFKNSLTKISFLQIQKSLDMIIETLSQNFHPYSILTS